MEALLKYKLQLLTLFLLVATVGYWLGDIAATRRFVRPTQVIRLKPPSESLKKPTPIKAVATSVAKFEREGSRAGIVEKPAPTPLSGRLTSAQLAEVAVEDLANQLVLGHLALRQLSLEDIEQNIKVAEALTQKDPNLYAGYKSKLINLLVKELKFAQAVPVEEYESLYEELLSFEGSDGPGELVEESEELVGIDNDIIHIPFLRFSAQGELGELEEVSQEYIEAFPESYIGYLYMAEALWRQGDPAMALEALKEGLGSQSTDEMVFHMFQQMQSNPLERIQRLSIE